MGIVSMLFVFVTGYLLFAETIIGESNPIIEKKAELVRPAQIFSRPEPYEKLSGGATTSHRLINQNAFSHPSSNMGFEKELNFKVGNGLFRRLWVSSPASIQAADGLGPLFNARSCQRCHLKDGRGHPPLANWPEDSAVSMLLRLSIPPQNEEQKQLLSTHKLNVIPDPVYGGQLQDLAIQGHKIEGHLHIEYQEIPVTLSGGEIASLRKPIYSIKNWGYGPPHPELRISPRVAPPMIGLGLLEAISAEDILSHADPDDLDGDGISGRPNWVWDKVNQEVTLGRFGWKAGNPSIRQQTAGAFSGDIGISTSLFPAGHGECTQSQIKCILAPDGNSSQYENVEAHEEILRLVVFYTKNLAVPARRNHDEPVVLKGKEIFYQAGCQSCHVPKFVTQYIPQQSLQSLQLIWPHTDLLLHDMGEGLADNRREGEANGREWRTPPLWGIGLTKVVSEHTYFLHDGRARNLLEAILWHGGEAESSKQHVVRLAPSERRALLAFLNSL